MLYFSTWKKALIIGAVVLGAIFAAPNLLSKDARESLPGFLPSKAVNLGLDLRGGVHLLVEAQVEDVWRQHMENLAYDVRAALKESGNIRRGVPEAGVDFVTVRINDAAEMDAAEAALRGLIKPVVSGTFGGSLGDDLILTRDGPQTLRLTLTEPAKTQMRDHVLGVALEVIRRRVDPTGTTEASIQRQGEGRVLVQVPGAEDSAPIKERIGKPARLSFHEVNLERSQDELARGRAPSGTMIVRDAVDPKNPDAARRYWAVDRRALISGEDVADASPGFDSRTNEAIVSFRFNQSAAKKFADFTKANVGKPFAIVLDGEVLSAPVIREAILGGSGQISGSFTPQSANTLAVQINAGALPADMIFLEERTVGPELGADSVRAGALACIAGFIGVMLFMWLVYGGMGLFANIALMSNVILIFGALSAIGGTLTLPGIAGIVLTIGMAVDANVLVFERIREETLAGKKVAQAIELGYEKALTSILDANITTLIACLVLFALGAGPVRGFAVTLGIGVITSVFTAYYVTRLMMGVWFERARPKAIMQKGLRMVPDNTKIGFVRVVKLCGALSAALVVASWALFAAQGLNYGIDFRGGTMIEARTPGAADLGVIRSAVSDLGLGDVAIQGFGAPSDVLVRIETQPGGDAAQKAVVDVVTQALQQAVDGVEIRRVELVGPKVSGELVTTGILAILSAVGAILVYIWLRFEWQFAVGAVLSLAHDVSLTIGVFSLIGLEFNLSIIAAILTIIGYSLNDTVIVYDRVRENLRKFKQMALPELIDLSINDTLSRTTMTSLTTLIALVALYVLGGEVISGFTFAMIWGIVVGTYSSIYVAAPILLWLGVKRDWSKPGADGPAGVQFGGAQV